MIKALVTHVVVVTAIGAAFAVIVYGLVIG